MVNRDPTMQFSPPHFHRLQ